MINVLLYILYLLLILSAFKKNSFFKHSSLSFQFLLFFFVLKICSSFVMYAIYSYYYTDRGTADIFKYYDDANILYKQLFHKSPLSYIQLLLGINQDSPIIYNALQETNFWYKPREFNIYNDNRTIIRLNMLIRILSNNFYHIHALIITFISFIGLLSIYKTFLFFFKHYSKLIASAVFLIPSVLFWSSANLKEGLLIGGLGIFVWMFVQLLHVYNSFKRKLFIASILIASGSLLIVIKPYILIVSIPSLIAWIIVKKKKNIKPFYIFIITHLILILSSLFIHKIIPSINIVQNITFKNNDFINVANDTKAGSSYAINKLDGNITSIIKNTVPAFINNFIRPYPSECNSIFVSFACIENFSILLLVIIAIFYLIKTQQTILPIQYYSIYISLLLGIIIGLIVPVFGASVRYKIPYLPFLVPTLLLIVYQHKHLKK
jgi:hypothetical protein